MSFSGTKGYITKPKPGVMLNPLHPLSRGLVGYWLFNEGSGSQAYDISGHDNHGTLKTMSPNAQGSGWSGAGLEFDGDDDYVNVPYSPSLACLDKMTIIFDFKADTAEQSDAVPAIVSMYDYANGKRMWGITPDTTHSPDLWEIMVSNDGVLNNRYPTTISLDTSPHTFAFVVDNPNKKWQVYLDGTYHQTVTVGETYIDTGSWVRFGGLSTDYNFNGQIKYVYFYNCVLSAAEIKQLYHDPFCNLMQVPIRRYSVVAPPVGAIMNQFQRTNIGADLYNGVLA